MSCSYRNDTPAIGICPRKHQVLSRQGYLGKTGGSFGTVDAYGLYGPHVSIAANIPRQDAVAFHPANHGGAVAHQDEVNATEWNTIVNG